MKPPKLSDLIAAMADKMTALEAGNSGELSIELQFNNGNLIAVDFLESEIVTAITTNESIEPQKVIDFLVDQIAIATADELHIKIGAAVTFQNGAISRFARTERRTYPMPKGPRLDLSI